MNDITSESYYVMEPEEKPSEEELKILEALEKLDGAKAETNQAFNETQNSEHYAQAYKPIAPPEDFEPTKTEPKDSDNDGKTDNAESFGNRPATAPAINEEALASFSKVNALLKQQTAERVNKKSTMHYSLVGRTHRYLPTPIYLCEEGGKIVVNINVNATGNVTKAYVNTSSTSSNECLIHHAIEYAKEAQFSEDASKKSQLGSITFYFIGKH
ncbi:hypothetical protein ACFFU9_01675 [Mariniflexile ostreae]|uniref:TonB family protein n=1 Tax=Mariniflexile ostreae TaxID=1520892 RepID=A0ABV5F7U4_9FLAO